MGNCAGIAEPLSQRRSEEGYGKLWHSPSRSPGGALFGERSLAAGMGTGRGRGEPWEIDPAEIKIMQRSDGGPWVLGEGASGSVSPLIVIWSLSTGAPHHAYTPKSHMSCTGRSPMKEWHLPRHTELVLAIPGMYQTP